MTTCGPLTTSLACDASTPDDTNLEATNNTSTVEGIINLHLPAGSKVYYNGDLMFTTDGDPDKSKIRIPPGE